MESQSRFKIITGEVGTYKPVEIKLVDGTENEVIWNNFVDKWHYLGYTKMVGQRVKYLVVWENIPLGAISYNRSSLRVGVRDNWIGWNEEGRKNY